MKIVYIIGPFRARTQWEIARNIRNAERLGLHVAHMGAMPLIPHMNTANFHGMLSDQFWIDGTKELAKRCDAAITVEALGISIENSMGSRGEVEAMKALGRPVFHELKDLSNWLMDECLTLSHIARLNVFK